MALQPIIRTTSINPSGLEEPGPIVPRCGRIRQSKAPGKLHSCYPESSRCLHQRSRVDLAQDGKGRPAARSRPAKGSFDATSPCRGRDYVMAEKKQSEIAIPKSKARKAVPPRGSRHSFFRHEFATEPRRRVGITGIPNDRRFRRCGRWDLTYATNSGSVTIAPL
jgi:hypothetical protein